MLTESAYPILCNKNLQKKNIIKVLTSAVRFLLCYQAYLNQMFNRG